MKQGFCWIFFCFSLYLSTTSVAQRNDIVPFIDFNKWFRCVENGMPKFIEMQEIKNYKAGDYVLAYIDIRGNLRIYDGQRHDISNMISIDYTVSDKIVAWNVANLLHVWQNGKTKTLTAFSDSSHYVVKDDIVVYADLRFNSILVHWNGREYPLKTSTSQLPQLRYNDKIGENVMAYEDNGGLYKIFYKGESYEVGVWNGDIDLKSGTDIVAFNDPNSRTFAVFDKGNFIDIENQWAKKYKAGRGFVVYEDANGNLMEYRNGQKNELSSFPQKWDVIDDIVVFENNGFTYSNVNGEITQVANFKIDDYKIKNASLVYRNLNGGLTAFIDGKIIELTNMPNAEFEIYGNSVLVKLFNNTFLVYQQGKLTRI